MLAEKINTNSLIEVNLQINIYIGVNLNKQAYVISAIVYRNNRTLILGMCDNSEFIEPIGKLQQNKNNEFYIKETHCNCWYTTTYYSEL